MCGRTGSPLCLTRRGLSSGASFALDYLQPYDFESLLAFFRYRALAGVEAVDANAYERTVNLRASDGESYQGWMRVSNDPCESRLVVSISESLVPVADDVAARVHSMFDLGCDPHAVSRALAPLARVVPSVRIDGVRVPGCFDPFETACRAILGQQVSVKAANKLAARIVETYGTRIETDRETLSRAWPAPSVFCALAPIEDALGILGVIRTRSRVIGALAAHAQSSEGGFDPDAPVVERMKRLLSIKGIGPWSASYVAMRTMGYADAFLETDAGVAHALPGLSAKERLALAECLKPYRSYAVLALWNSLG